MMSRSARCLCIVDSENDGMSQQRRGFIISQCILRAFLLRHNNGQADRHTDGHTKMVIQRLQQHCLDGYVGRHAYIYIYPLYEARHIDATRINQHIKSLIDSTTNNRSLF